MLTCHQSWMLTLALSLEIFCKLSTWELFDLWWSEQHWRHPAPRWRCYSWSKDRAGWVRQSECGEKFPALLSSASWSVSTPKVGSCSSVKADFSLTSVVARTLLRMLDPRVMVVISFLAWLLTGSSSSVSGRSRSNVLSAEYNCVGRFRQTESEPWPTIVSAGDVVSYLVPWLAALTEHAQLLVQHSLELVGGHVGDTLVGLQALQLVQAPVQLLQGVHGQADIGSLLCNIKMSDLGGMWWPIECPLFARLWEFGVLPQKIMFIGMI